MTEDNDQVIRQAYKIAGLIRAAGFDPVRVGGLDQSIRIEMFGDLHEYGALGRVVTKSEALKAI
jgi:8-hydroxy-5-deazaflavin:NADPH oxidoreductase